MVRDFAHDLEDLSEKEDESFHELEKLAYSRPLFNQRFREILNDDVAYAVFSVSFVLLYMWFHLESFCLAATGIILILLSFPVSYFIYSGVFNITMNTTMN